MAINDHPDVRCTHPAHQDLPPAAAFVRDITGLASAWRPRCAEHVARILDDPDAYPTITDVVYLDPARVRGTSSDHDDEPTEQRAATFADFGYPDPAP